jgi:hypothetical protein
MADVARCRCLLDVNGKPNPINPACPIHGYSSPHPQKPYLLTQGDKDALKAIKIAVTDAAAIEEVRKADEDRFRRD